MTYKVIVAGGREFKDYALLRSKLDRLLSQKEDVEIVTAKARGADVLGEKYAIERNIKRNSKAPDWIKHPNYAGFVRNNEMAEYADALVAFWDGKSKGTKHMIDLAEKKGLAVRVIRY